MTLLLFCTRPITKKLNGTSRAEIILHVTMTSVLLGHMTNTYGFVFTFMSSITTEFSIREVNIHQSILHLMTMFLFLDHVTNFYEFILTSLDFMTNELERMTDQQVMTSHFTLRTHVNH